MLALQLGVLALLVFPFVSATFRDNDQATILGSSWQVARGQAPFLHATFYNFDKQWGVFLALSILFRAFPHADPVLAANFLLTVVVSLAWISLGFRTGRSRTAPLPLLLPILLSPVLVLYMPFLGTGWFSLAFLLLAFFLLGDVRSKPARVWGIVLLAVATACRGDVVLAVPALTLSLMSRARLGRFLRRPLVWQIGAAAVFPVLLGKLMAGATIADTNPLSFDLRSYAGFLLFGLTPAILTLLLLTFVVSLAIALKKPRFRIFYLSLSVAPLIPLGFYSLQLYTLRYFFLTIASVLFITSSPRAIAVYRAASKQRWLAATLVTLTVTPWLVGLKLPLLNRPGLTAGDPTRFPTGDGKFPMGAYLGFEQQVLFRDHLAIDHNQKIWLAARSVSYENCSGGTVPFLITPMSNFVEFAIRLQGKTPLGIDYQAESPCGVSYVDARSVIRGYRPVPRDGDFFNDAIAFVSSAGNGQLILRVDSKGKSSPEARILQTLRQALGERDAEIFSGTRFKIPVEPGLRYAVFSTDRCQVSLGGSAVAVSKGLLQASWTGSVESDAEAACPVGSAGWARSVLPPYMGL